MTKTGDLRRVLGLPFALMAVIGGSIGSGILRAPGPVAAAVPEVVPMIAMWLAGGLLALVEAMPLMELAAALPRAGGPTVYVERAFGRWPGALVGWSSWLQCVVSLAFLAVVAGEFAVRLGAPLPVPVIAPALILVLTLANCIEARANSRTQTAVQVAKVIGIVALTLLILAAPAHAASAAPAPAMTTVGVAFAALLVHNTYQGWGGIVTFGEEMRDPVRAMARALFGGIALLAVIYLATVAALLHALPIAAIAASTLPAADAAARVAGPAAERLITLLSLVSVIALANLTAMLGARILLAMARAGSVPAVLARVERNGAPAMATVVGSVGAALLASSGAYLALNALYAPLAVFTATAVLLAVVRLRRREPELSRPWRMPGYPAPVVVALAANAVLFVAIAVAAPWQLLGAVALLAVGALLPLVFGRATRR